MIDAVGAENALQVIEVAGRAARRQFLGLPRRLYADDSAWVAPLEIQAREQIDPAQPFFEHADMALYIAWRSGAPVGRISAHVDHLVEATQGVKAGFFGLLESENDPAVFAALLRAAGQWLRERGCTCMQGPFNLNVNQELGVLVEGFETPPYIMMGHARPWYGAQIEAAGLSPVKDLLAYELDPDFETPAVMQRLLRRLRGRVRLRPLERARRDADLEIMRQIFNDAWSGNWGFVPFTEAEFQRIGRELVRLLPRDFIQMAELDGEPVAFIAMLPNLNEAIRDLHGRLLPHGWVKLLWRLFVRFPGTGRVPLMGVRRSFHNTWLGPGLAFAVIDAARSAARRKHIRTLELSWILEDNEGMRSIIETLGGRISKRYRMYECPLDDIGNPTS